MAYNFVEKRYGKYILNHNMSGRILASNASLEGFVEDIKNLSHEELGGGIYTGHPSKTNKEGLEGEENQKFWDIYNSPLPVLKHNNL